MSLLVLTRHAESVYNQLGLWAGVTDTPLSEIGEIEAQETGRQIKNIDPDIEWNVFVSPLSRTKRTAAIAIESAGLHVKSLKIVHEITERDYGVYTGLNKAEVKKQLGDDEFLKLRRSFDYPIEQGESLKEVYKRIVPWYTEFVLPMLAEGEDILMIAHGNSLRALIKYIESVSDEDIAEVELETGKPRVYKFEDDILTRLS
jgi:2,3-bisphosphoglycerate-dependent phosphoglycerate mutase